MGRLLAKSSDGAITTPGNFVFIYSKDDYRREFREFLVNVFHLYPENDMQSMLEQLTSTYSSDEDIYRQAQSQLGDIKPILGDLTYSLPALRKQKQEMAIQTAQLLGTEERFEGYLELGSNGRYLDSLEEELEIVGERFTIAPIPPDYSPVDMLDRGQVFTAGNFIDLNNYETDFAAQIPANSLDLVSVYIGFHHCPIYLREEFFANLRNTMKPGAALIVRDHDARDEKMIRTVALAHDVFNMGTLETWEYNEAELRNFYSLDTLHDMLTKAGFKGDGTRLFQEGDPTLNALMLYRKG
jgi:hypothetical protein